MNTNNKVLLSLIAFLMISFSFIIEAKADIIIIDFDSATSGGVPPQAHLEDGFRVECISSHYDIFETGGTSNSPYLGIDMLPDGEGIPSKVRLSSSTSGIFNLISFETFNLYVDWDVIDVTSSAGGNITFDTNGIQNFTGSEWRDLSWVDFSSAAGIAGPGFDTIILSTVPIPGAAWLFSSGLLGLAVYRSKIRRQ